MSPDFAKDIWQANLNALAVHNPRLMTSLGRLEAQSCSRQKRDGCVTVQHQGGAAICFDQGVQLSLEKPAEILVVFGFGSGALTQAALSQKGVGEVLLYVPDVVLWAQVLAQVDCSSFLGSPRLRVIVGNQPVDVADGVFSFFLEDSARLTRVESLLCFTSPGEDQIAGQPQLFERFLTLLHEQIDRLFREMEPNVEDAFWGLINTQRNFPDYFELPSLSLCRKIFKGLPGIVVGTGPSLSKSLPLLAQHQDRFVIFACDSALSVLQKNGISADFVASMERLGTIVHLFEEMQNALESWLVAPAILDPRAFAAYKGPKLSFFRDIGFENWFVDTKERIPAGSSPSHFSCMGLALLGCDPIYLLGHDGAYDPQTGLSHECQANPYIHKVEATHQGFVKAVARFEVPGHDGTTQLTNETWFGFVRWWPHVVLQLEGASVVNLMPRGYGIPIEKIPRQLPEEVLSGAIFPIPDKKKRIAEAVSVHHIPTDFQKLAGQKKEILFAGLLHLQKTSLKVMRGISQFRMENDIRVPGYGKEEAYQAFFGKLRQIQSDLMEQDNRFFHDYFLPLIHSHHTWLAIQFSRAVGQKDLFGRTNTMTGLWLEWFNLLHLWSSRALELLESAVNE